ncbi:MAG: hypothetical protein ACE5GV_08995 [Candidatus Scalindua sp.]
MKIKFSRHAKRRGKLYKIPETTVSNILKNMKLTQGKHEILKKINELKYPLRIVIDVKDDIITVITNYPLKKGRKK